MAKLICYLLIAVALGGGAGFLVGFITSFAQSLKYAHEAGAMGWMAAFIFGDVLHGMQSASIGVCVLAPLGFTTGMFDILIRWWVSRGEKH